MATKLYAPHGTTLNVHGQLIPQAKDGSFDVPEPHAREVAAAFGLSLVPLPQPKAAAPARAKPLAPPVAPAAAAQPTLVRDGEKVQAPTDSAAPPPRAATEADEEDDEPEREPAGEGAQGELEEQGEASRRGRGRKG